ncbi:MAG: ABC transporter ATP-binding protein, partial [Proteobacteria bacterium]|nr:ABC transporter ATP-binding protein [Pseudomonadota bacterium]
MRGGGATTPGGNYSTGTTGAGGPVGRNAVAGSGGTWKDVWRALGFLRAHRRSVVISYIAWTVANFLDLMIPLQVRDAIDIGIGTKDTHVLTVAVISAMGLYVAKSAINWVYIWGFHAFEADAARDLRNAVYRGLQRLSFGYLDRADTGQHAHSGAQRAADKGPQQVHRRTRRDKALGDV